MKSMVAESDQAAVYFVFEGAHTGTFPQRDDP
ncbi:hypothetical protein OZL92_11805 [Bacillus sonorensis]|nr:MULTISPECIES: hypothetical protein [Bacillus]MCF7619127.1 hypothetical protein [Bacillus sonorensis]MCY7855490.1 hypothetical protein [Bacillus sonorensis]MCY8025128.1 hypothetical protein [Bacillus sonorensis]MCY8032361.1 hypothetical protein [Bacillus sonorensis]MCY8087046.1 hypothetical protein [Bacillus sonorensis]